ncbi:transporter substrate-binding domain-containing protein [Vibrio sp. S4M6]|uniref:substrate-binding periplasmic protein n=1 Tax=Vibrio sinus TaxID=2946865 RepID=UPI00202A0A72|nr:transporter substrate-binding domain-containing protein [Vibrio sinus]MCL9781188.1 transporter substrate-binding domain-containing protein [Vibrio sinus]
MALLVKSNLLIWMVVLCLATLNASAKTLQLVTLDYPPYIYNNNGKVDGIATRVVEEVFRRLNQPIEIQILPWARSIHYLKTGKADAIYTIFKTPERLAFADYSQLVLFDQNIALFTNANQDIAFNGELKELSEYIFCVEIGVSYGKIFDEAVKSGLITKMTETRSARQCMNLLLRKRVDIWINNHFGGLAIAKSESALPYIHTLASSIQSTPSYIAFSKINQHQKIRDQFDRVFQEMIKDGTYDNIVAEFIGN